MLCRISTDFAILDILCTRAYIVAYKYCKVILERISLGRRFALSERSLPPIILCNPSLQPLPLTKSR